MRGLVLGGGGPVGFCWYAGLASGLADGGVDLRDADVIVGTSAGAQAGAWLAADCDLDEFAETACSLDTVYAGQNFADDADPDHLFEFYGLISELEEPAPAEVLHQMAELARRVDPPEGDPNWYVRERAGRWVPSGTAWPERFFAAVVSVATAQFTLLGPEDGVDLAQGVAASCAAPGIVPPVDVNGVPMMDGGARSATNADALLAFGVATALVITPVSARLEAMGQMLEAEVHELESAGITVEVIRPSQREEAAFGLDLLNSSLALPAVEAGTATGRKVAATLSTWLA